MNTKTALEIEVINNGFIEPSYIEYGYTASAILLVHVANKNVYNTAMGGVVIYCRKSFIQIQID